MSTRSIRTSATQAACDVCGRTLLRGERAEIYVSGGARHSVCELCTSRALHGGWVREGTLPEYADGSAGPDRRRSLLARLWGRRDGGPDAGREPYQVELEPGPAPDGREPAQPAPAPDWLQSNGAESVSPAHDRDAGDRERRRRPARRRDPGRRDPGRRDPSQVEAGHRQRRHVRAVPTSIEHKISSAVSLFNDSEYPRTVAGITRSLGPPEASVYPSDSLPSVVNVIVAWELCWYRYEADLSDEVPTFRVADQGLELSELDPTERRLNAAADDRGRLELTT